MEIALVRPLGYCMGVNAAFSLAYAAKKEHPEEKIHLLGLLVHNEDAMATLERLGFIVLDERQAPLQEQLEGLNRGDIVVFSAHGHPESFDEVAKKKGLIVYDATCTFVKENLSFARANKEKGIIYIGAKGHLEAESFRRNAPFAGFYDVKSKNLEQPPETEATIIMSQTTLSHDEILSAVSDIQKSYPNAQLSKGRCLATKSRQDELAKALQKGAEAAFIIGSSLSSNTKKLRDIALSYGVPTFMALNLEELQAMELPPIKKAVLTCGASTSSEEATRCAAYLESLSS